MDISGPRTTRSDENYQTTQSILGNKTQSHNAKFQYVNVMYTNADSLRNKMTELNIRLSTRCNNNEEIHIIAVTEVNSKVTSDSTEMCEYQLKGYDMFYVNQSPNEGRGLILYVKQELEATPVSFNVQFQESIWTSISIDANTKNSMLIGCIYRNPNSTDENNYQLLQLLKEANSNRYASVLILGDFNYPHINWDLEHINNGGDSDTAKFLETIKDTFLFQHIRTPTRSRSCQTSNILDLVFTREEEEIKDLVIEAPLGHSDHAVITFRMCCDKEVTVTNTVKYLYDKGDYHSMFQELSRINWKQQLHDNFKDDTEKQWQFFKRKYMDLVNKYIPKKHLQRTNRQAKRANIIKKLQYLLEKNIVYGNVLWRPKTHRNILPMCKQETKPKLSLDDSSEIHAIRLPVMPK